MVNWFKALTIVLNVAHFDIQQRYTAVLFYYKMGKGTDFKLDVNSNVCEWDRIECDEGGHSRFLLFDDCDIRGPIPSIEIQALSRKFLW